MGTLRTGRWLLGFRFLAATLACGIATGCASGGFTATRTVAKWLNSQMIVLRVLLYIVIFPVFIVTLLADEILLNTIDFWSGKVSAQNDAFEKDGVRVQLAHSRTPLRRSVITIDGKNGEHSVIELRETLAGSIEVYKDGLKRNEVKDIQSALPTLVAYQGDGRSTAWTRVLEIESLSDLKTLPAQEGYAQMVAQLGLAGSMPSMTLVCSQ